MIDTARGSTPAVDVTAGAAEPDGWGDLLAACADADYSHTTHWQRCACAHQPGAAPLWLTARSAGRLVGGLVAVGGPRRLAGGLVRVQRLDSSLDGTSGGPLVRDDLPATRRDAVFDALVAAFAGRRRGGWSAATFALNPGSEARFGARLAGAGNWIRHDSPTAMIPLAGGAEAVAKDCWNNTKRNERNRGLKRGAEVVVTRDPDLVAAYHPLHVAASAHWGLPPVPLGRLQDLLRDPDDRVFFTCVRLEGRVIGGHLCLHHGERVFAWNGVTDPAFARSHFPGTLCFWGDVQEACRRGAAWLDIGASGGVHSLEGFKKYLGAEIRPRGWYVAESGPVRVLRRVRERLAAGRGAAPRRWH
ncbi:GNAT family N-acetyltransferase, partial [bacterium]|nr:GNAT family N-acetyltransferase [bacterium]